MFFNLASISFLMKKMVGDEPFLLLACLFSWGDWLFAVSTSACLKCILMYAKKSCHFNTVSIMWAFVIYWFTDYHPEKSVPDTLLCYHELLHVTIQEVGSKFHKGIFAPQVQVKYVNMHDGEIGLKISSPTADNGLYHCTMYWTLCSHLGGGVRPVN